MNWNGIPPLSALRAFSVVARTGGFSSAGQELNVSHAAISQHVRKLEEHLGTSLLQRGPRGSALTADGARLAEALGSAFQVIADAISEFDTSNSGRPLQITMTPAFAVSWLMPRIPEFTHENPDIELMLNPTTDLVPLTPGGVDLAIRFGSGKWPGVDTTPLFETNIVIVATPGLLAGRTINHPEDLFDLRWLQEPGRNEISDWLSGHGILSRKNENLTYLPGYLAMQGVQNGLGITAVARAFVEDEIRNGTLVVLFEDILPGTGYHVVTRPGVMRGPLKAFVEWLRRHAQTPHRRLHANV